jgi:hypothetical protein
VYSTVRRGSVKLGGGVVMTGGFHFELSFSRHGKTTN